MLGPELSLTSITRTSRMPGPATARRWRGDSAAIIALLALPVLVYGVPALLGHPVLPGDDLTQNFPLRVLAGHEIRSGHLPLYNPFIWSGAPLLGDWNAGAAYPFTLLFAVTPPVAAWTLNMIATWATAGIGMFVFLRACRLGCGPAVLGALSFAFAGAMAAQVAHFGLVAGMSWVPVQLLCVLRIRVIRSVAATAGWSATWHPRRGAAAPLAVRRDGLVQAVDVPAGRGMVIWSYRPPGFRAGFALSLGAAAFIFLLLLASGLCLVRSGRTRESAWDPGPPRRVLEPMVRKG